MYDNRMSFKEAYISFWKNGLDFKGRARRKEYWTPMIVNYLIYCGFVVLFILFAALMVMTSTDRYTSPVVLMLPILYFGMMIFNLVLFIPNLSVLVRRFHDIGQSAKLIIGIFIGMFILPIFSAILVALTATKYSNDMNAIQVFIILFTFLIYIGVGIWMLYMTVKDSQPGPNKWGPNPKEMPQSSTQYNGYEARFENHI